MPVPPPPPPPPPSLAAPALPAARPVRRLPAADAHQGVAAGGDALYAIDDSAIARLDPASGRVVRRWQGDPARYPHINSCIVRGARLICAASSYPAVPMWSRMEVFDAVSLRPLASRRIDGPGSLTWLDWHKGGWWACYANYDGKGGVPGRDHAATRLVRYDRHFRETGRWPLPPALLDRLAPRSASGGAWGADGLLYMTGHDRPELYAVRVPATGDRLTLVATIATPTGGQAISWDPRRPRLLWSIDRAGSAVVASQVPPVAAR
ncbi:hypothetical protein [Sphingomonas morindae]|uniref:Uncharacterized protein n=1 Tax=Sphingomonas morindae TaxID=1541170 RepID=A0ABY4X3K9_9SPHN|nr:hypothetical protein [Sphingomonas morindae]USI71489.1 hypothetical protein LHA26_09055 [Sphingomonas morindae]